MIDFELGEELELIRHTAREFGAMQLRPSLREHEAAREPSAATKRSFTEIGFAGLECPESLGGSALGALARCVVMEELGAADAGAAVALDRIGPALYPIAELGGDEALARFVGPIVDATEERAVLVWNGRETRAPLEISSDRVRGTVPWVPAGRADLLVVLDETSCTLVEQGISCTALRGGGLRAAGATELSLENAPIAARFDGREGAARALARARLYVTALLVGVMRESAEFSRQYALDRVAFGRPIAHHQGLAFLIADMAIAVEASRCLLWEAAFRLDDSEARELAGPASSPEAAATAFLEASEQAMFVTPNGVQILGGHGFMQDYPVEKMMREARALSLLLGGPDLAREDSGNELATCAGTVPLSLEASG